MAEKVYFTPDRRKANTKLVIDQLSAIDNLDFNSIMFTFADIIHTTFLNSLLIGKTQEQRDEAENGIIELNHKIIDVLNDNSNDMRYDMIVLANLIMDAVEMATQEALKDIPENQA